jgi:hypothetical protein
MFSELFAAKPAPPEKAKATKKKPAPPKKKKPKAGPEPQKADQECAPFEHVEEASPEPAKVATLEYDLLQEEDYNEWDADDEFQLSDDESNYEVSSMSRNGDDDDILEDDVPYGSIQSSPGLFMQGLKSTSVQVEKKRPAGIAVSFDDDSWIE